MAPTCAGRTTGAVPLMASRGVASVPGRRLPEVHLSYTTGAGS